MITTWKQFNFMSTMDTVHPELKSGLFMGEYFYEDSKTIHYIVCHSKTITPCDSVPYTLLQYILALFQGK